jgi:hypothetical protein
LTDTPPTTHSVIVGKLFLTMQDVTAFLEKHEEIIDLEHSENILTSLGYLSSQMEKICYIEEISLTERTPKQTLVLDGLRENAQKMILEVESTLKSFTLTPHIPNPNPKVAPND